MTLKSFEILFLETTLTYQKMQRLLVVKYFLTCQSGIFHHFGRISRIIPFEKIRRLPKISETSDRQFIS